MPTTTPKRPINKPLDESQHARFLESARALGCDEDAAAFDEKLRSIARKSEIKEAHRPKDAIKAKP